MTLQSILLEFLFPFYLTILKVKITESQKTKDRKTLDLNAGWTFESFHQQVWVDQRLWGKYSWMKWGPKLQEADPMS